MLRKNSATYVNWITWLKDHDSTAPPKIKSLSGWRTIGTSRYFFRSKWEANYARWLQYQKNQHFIKDWLYETQTFWFDKIKRGVRSYLPDFKIIKPDDSHFWVEVKGWMDPKSVTKIKRFAKYYPKELLIVVD